MQAWKDSTLQHTVSPMQKDVATVLSHMGIHHSLEHLTYDGYLSIGIYVPEVDGKVVDLALEVDGPSHFCVNTRTPKGKQDVHD